MLSSTLYGNSVDSENFLSFIFIPSDEELKVTLWENRAKEFKVPTISASENPYSIVVLFVSCLPTTLHSKSSTTSIICLTIFCYYMLFCVLISFQSWYLDIIQVYGGNPCQWYFNPDIKEAQPLYNR